MPGACPPMRPNSFFFAYLFTKKHPHWRSTPPPNGCTPPLWEILDLPLTAIPGKESLKEFRLFLWKQVLLSEIDGRIKPLYEQRMLKRKVMPEWEWLENWELHWTCHVTKSTNTKHEISIYSKSAWNHENILKTKNYFEIFLEKSFNSISTDTMV